MHNSTYSHLQSLGDNDDKLVLFTKITLAKMINLGRADTQYINNLLDPFFS